MGFQARNGRFIAYAPVTGQGFRNYSVQLRIRREPREFVISVRVGPTSVERCCYGAHWQFYGDDEDWERMGVVIGMAHL